LVKRGSQNLAIRNSALTPFIIKLVRTLDGISLNSNNKCVAYFNIIANSQTNLLWRNGMCGLKDHDCRARMEARQGREGATRQQNNQITKYQQDIGIS
jgi:hypothetical protein